MLITRLHAKLHRACVTGADLHYEGSIAIDKDLLRLAQMTPYEKVDIYNINNGQRFSTYIIEAAAGSKEVSLNGAAARMVQKGDRIIVCAYRHYSMDENPLEPRVVLLDEFNTPSILDPKQPEIL